MCFLQTIAYSLSKSSEGKRMTITTKRMVLRPWKESDAESLYEYAKDDRVGPIAGWPVHQNIDVSLQVIREVFMRPHIFAITLKGEDKAIGLIGYLVGKDANFAIGDNNGEISYWIGVPYWGQGLVPEATKSIIDYGFKDMALDNLWCGYYADNEQSHKVQAKCGFQYHSTEENIRNPVMNDYRTKYITRLTKDEWFAKTG